MALTDKAPDALARVYAQAIFELAKAQGVEALESTIGELEEILELARSDNRFAEFLGSRIITGGARERSLRTIFGGRINETTLRFLVVLNRKGRLGHLSPIVKALDELIQREFGRVEVDVFTATPADAAELEKIRVSLRASLGKEPVIHAYTQPAMIGGLKLQIGDRLIDGSIATRLQRMKARLTSDGAATIRATSGQILDSGGEFASRNGH